MVEVKVPIRLTGKARGIDNGGIVDHALRELELACLPLAIPREITVDVSGLDIGSSLHVRDLVLPEGVELRSDLDLSVVSVVTPKAEEEAAPAEAVAVEGEAPAEGEAAEGAEKAEGDKAAADRKPARKADAPAPKTAVKARKKIVKDEGEKKE